MEIDNINNQQNISPKLPANPIKETPTTENDNDRLPNTFQNNPPRDDQSTNRTNNSS